MADPIMITVKQADGTMKQVPLSSLKKADDAKKNDKTSEIPEAVVTEKTDEAKGATNAEDTQKAEEAVPQETNIDKSESATGPAQQAPSKKEDLSTTDIVQSTENPAEASAGSIQKGIEETQADESQTTVPSKPEDKLALLASLQQKGKERTEEVKKEEVMIVDPTVERVNKKVRKKRKEASTSSQAITQPQEPASTPTPASDTQVEPKTPDLSKYATPVSPKEEKQTPSAPQESQNSTEATPVVPILESTSASPERTTAVKENSTSEALVTVETPSVPSTTTPNTHVFEHAIADVTPWRPADVAPPLESIPNAPKTPPTPKIMVDIPDAVSAVLVKHEIVLEDRLKKRLSQLIDSLKRTVRTPVQFLDALTKDTIRGGMAFDPSVAQSVLDALGLDVEPDPAALPPPNSSEPAVASPETVVPIETRPTASPDMSPHMPSLGGAKKVPVTDVAPPPPAIHRTETLDPVEELGSMTLDDFRRLGGRDAVGLTELKHKFEVLLKESIIIYLKAVEAWHQSPLFKTYIAVATESINSGTPVAALLQGGDGCTLEEWQAIQELQKEIRL